VLKFRGLGQRGNMEAEACRSPLWQWQWQTIVGFVLPQTRGAPHSSSCASGLVATGAHCGDASGHRSPECDALTKNGRHALEMLNIWAREEKRGLLKEFEPEAV
jgi:hypothetical protein